MGVTICRDAAMPKKDPEDTEPAVAGSNFVSNMGPKDMWPGED
jgi:hypothetical protein